MPSSANTTVIARAKVYLAPVGTVAPVDATTAPGAGWIDVGYTTPDSLSFSTDPQFEEIQTAQSDFPVRRFQTSDSASLNVDLLEWSGANFKAVYGGGTVSSPAVGVYKFVPPRIGDRTETAAMIDVNDGTKKYRYIFPRVIQVEGVENQLSKGAQSTLPLRLSVLGADATDAWYMLSSDAAFTP